jgi:hypothetical protein
MESKKARRLPGAAPGGGADAAPTRGAPAGGLRRFIIPAWLRTEPPELSAVPAEEVVYFERRRPPKTEGHMRAGELLSDIRDTMARQAEGFFTLSEAAQVLAESRPDVDPLEVIDQMRQAHATGRLRVHHGGRRKGRFAVRQGEAVRAFRDLVASEELDRWLRESTGYGFPAYSPIDAAPPEAARDRGRCLQRRELISQNFPRWRSIERDLQDAATNGLTRAAWTGSRGFWWEGDALDWARARGKLKEAPEGLPRIVHRMKG